MAPKKKGSKKAQDDWESELGESIDPIKQATQDAKAAEATKEEEENGMGGGLVAALKKNRNRKKARGIVVDEDVEGEETGEGEAGTKAEVVDLESKAPQEATFEDEEEDMFGGGGKKGKGGKGAQKQQQQAKDEDEGEEDGVGKVKTKKEKEKEKKEREKQRKKEQVWILFFGKLVLLPEWLANRRL